MTENNEGLEKASQVDLSRNLKDKGSAKQEDESSSRGNSLFVSIVVTLVFPGIKQRW